MRKIILLILIVLLILTSAVFAMGDPTLPGGVSRVGDNLRFITGTGEFRMVPVTWTRWAVWKDPVHDRFTRLRFAFSSLDENGNAVGSPIFGFYCYEVEWRTGIADGDFLKNYYGLKDKAVAALGSPDLPHGFKVEAVLEVWASPPVPLSRDMARVEKIAALFTLIQELNEELELALIGETFIACRETFVDFLLARVAEVEAEIVILERTPRNPYRWYCTRDEHHILTNARGLRGATGWLATTMRNAPNGGYAWYYSEYGAVADRPDFVAVDISPLPHKTEVRTTYNSTATFSLEADFLGAGEVLEAKINITHNGWPIVMNELINLAHGETFARSFDWSGQAGGSRLKIEIQPVTGEDKDLSNNILEKIIPSDELPDFSVTIEPHYIENANPGSRVGGIATFVLSGSIPRTAVISLIHRVGSTNHNIRVEAREFVPGVPQEISFTVTAQDQIMTEVIAEIANSDPALDINIYNNKFTMPIFRSAMVFVPPAITRGTATLSFQAASKWDGAQRQPGTAKWTDNVRATLRVATPPNINISTSRYQRQLVRIEVVSATLSVPRAHHDFAFGYPVTPIWSGGFWQSPVQRSFTTGTQTVTADFVQNWSLAGTPMFVVLFDEMMCSPRNYPIRANYNKNVHFRERWWTIVRWRSWSFTWTSGDPPVTRTISGSTPIWGWGSWHSRTMSLSGDVVSPIHVDGTGTWPVGQ